MCECVGVRGLMADHVQGIPNFLQAVCAMLHLAWFGNSLFLFFFFFFFFGGGGGGGGVNNYKSINQTKSGMQVRGYTNY